MSATSLSILFFLRKKRLNEDGEAPIYMRITVNGKRVELSTSRTIDPNYWNKNGGFVKGYKNNELKSYLESLKQRIFEYQRELITENKEVTVKSLKNKFHGYDPTQKTLVEVFDYHNKIIEDNIGIEYAKATHKRYETTKKHVTEYLLFKFYQDDIQLKELNYEFITDFERYLKTENNCNHNTAVKYIKNLRKVINFALKNEWINKDPFIKYETKIKPVKREFLTSEELENIENKEIKIERLKVVRDIFVFSCYTGLSYIDVASLTPDHIKIGIDKQKWIFTSRTKTKNQSFIPLLEKAEQILKIYEKHPKCINENKLLPVYSNVKLNAYLKEIADICEIHKNLTFHMARHTFATTITLTNDVPIESVSSMLGHKSIRTTQIYAKVIEKKVSSDMMALRNKLSSKEKDVKHKDKKSQNDA